VFKVGGIDSDFRGIYSSCAIDLTEVNSCSEEIIFLWE